MSKQKGISTLVGIIIIIAAIIILFGGVFAYQNFSTPNNPKIEKSTDQTAIWKTYTNTQYGFEVKYPANGFVQTGDNSELQTGSNLVDINLWTSNNGALHPERKTMYIQVDEAVSMHPCGDPFKNPDGTITKNLTDAYLNGVKFTKGDVSPYRNLDLAFANEYCTVRNGNRYQIIVGQYIFGGTGPGPNSPTYSGLESDTLINQAISTFKFTK